MIAVAGLGNPGKKYESTRHNLGFEVIDRLAERLEVTRWEHKFDAEIAAGRQGDQRFFLLKPQTFMNHSGHALQAALHFYKIPPDRLLVIVDDMDLAVGKIRQRAQGSDGGHRGLRSVAESLGTKTFPRIRIGVGRPGPGESAVSRVLRKPADPEEAEILAQAIQTAAEVAADFIATGLLEQRSTG